MSGKRSSNFRARVRNSFTALLPACAVFTPQLGCGDAGGELETTAPTRAALVGGNASGTERDAVVFVRGNHPNGAFSDCTGTLVSSRVVITAKHCVTAVQPGKFVCSGAGALVEDGNGAGLFGAKLEAGHVEIHTGAKPSGGPAALGLQLFTTESADACHDDVAAIVLDRALEPASYPTLRTSRVTTVGETVRLVGYGPGERPGVIERREITDLRLLDVASPDGGENPNATTPRRTFVTAGATACFGDSGGPALAMDTGALVGVYSRITGDCFAPESRNTFMQVASFQELFGRAFERAGEQPVSEPAPESAPEDASAGAAGAAGEPPATEPSRHEAFQCAIGASERAQPSSLVTIGLLLSSALYWLTRRRFVRRPS